MHEINEKQRRFAINFIIYIITFCFLALIGISRPLADTNINMSSWTNITGRKWSSNLYDSSSDIISDTDTIRAFYNVSSPIYTPPNSYDYVDFLYFQNNSGSNFNPCNGDDFKTNFYLKFSTPIFVNYVTRVRFSYHSDTGLDSCIISSRNSSTGRVDVSCSTHYESNSNSLVIWIDFNRNIPDTQNSWLYIQKNFSLSCMTNSQAIINNQNQNTQNIINNNNQNTQDIINNQNSNNQAVIDNQNQNTQDIINSNQACFQIDKVNILHQKSILNSAGELLSQNTTWGVTDYINIYRSTIKPYNLQGNLNSMCFYNINKSLISCTTIGSMSDGGMLSIPDDSYYARFSIDSSTNRPQFEICQNGEQALLDDNKESEKTRKGILSKIKELFSWFSNDDDADISGLDNMVGWLPPGPVDSIINLPLAFFNALTNTLSGTCQDVSLTLPFVNQTLVLPCFDSYMTQYLNHFGTFWNLVGFIVSIFILYNYLLALYKWVDDTLTFRENNLPGYYGDNWGGGA